MTRPCWCRADRGAAGQLLLVICVAGPARRGWASSHTAAPGSSSPSIAVGVRRVHRRRASSARLTMPGNREVAPVGAAAALGYTLLLDLGGAQLRHRRSRSSPCIAVGMFAGALPHLAVGRPPRLDAMARRLLTGALLAFAFRPLADRSSGPQGQQGTWWPALGVMVVLILAHAADRRADRRPAPGRATARRLPGGGARRARRAPARSAPPSAPPACCSPWPRTAWTWWPCWSSPPRCWSPRWPSASTPAIRATYLQTVRALSRVTEVGGYVEPGHSRRVSRLAVAVGRELGMAEPELLELEYAALMHDIGQLSLQRPDPRRRDRAGRPAEQARASPSWAPR